MILTGDQLRAGRALASLDQAQLAKLADVGINTIRNLEAAGSEPLGGYAATHEKVQRALEKVGIEFTNGDAPGVRLRRRADGPSGASKSASPESAAPDRKARRQASAKMAGRAIDQVDDKTATAEERDSRKRRLIKGPKEFRDIRARRRKD
jgi:transcriptional regulator with XRE-family HTH domain